MRKLEKEQLKDKKKPPIKTERITCDDYIVEEDGEEYHPHLNEWVDILPIRQLSELRNLMKLASAEAIEGASITDPRVFDQYDQLCVYLSDTIFNWSFTNNADQELPNPYKKPEVIENLSVDEIGYLVGKLIGGRTDNSKND